MISIAGILFLIVDLAEEPVQTKEKGNFVIDLNRYLYHSRIRN